MAKLKKNIAGLVLKGISILGILFGLSCVFPIMMIFFIQRDDLDLLWLWLLLSGSLMLLGAWLMYDSYLMFRKKSFRAIKSIPAVLALFAFDLPVRLVKSFETASVSGRVTRYIEDVIAFASFIVAWILFLLVYLIFTKLLKKLVEAAYGPPQNF